MKRGLWMTVSTVLFVLVATVSFAQTKRALTIDCDRSGAQVLVNGRLIGETRPKLIVMLLPNTYNITVQYQGLTPFQTRVTIGPSPVTIQVRFGSISGPEPEPSIQPLPSNPAPTIAPAPVVQAAPAPLPVSVQADPYTAIPDLVWRLGTPAEPAPGVSWANTLAAADQLGRPGMAFTISGRGGVISVPDAPALNPSQEITVAAWVRPMSFRGNGINTVIEKAVSTTEARYQYKLYVTGDQYGKPGAGTCGFRLHLGKTMVDAQAPRGAWQPGRWIFMVGTYDGNSARLYLNGQLAAEARGAGPLSTSGTAIYLGRYTNLPNLDSLPADIADVSIWSRALSQDEIGKLQANSVVPRGFLSAPPAAAPGSAPSARLRFEGESYLTGSSGIRREEISPPEGGTSLAFIEDRAYAYYGKVDFGAGVNLFRARVASGTMGGTIELHLRSPSGPSVGSCSVPGTGGWHSYTTVESRIPGAMGEQDLYLVFSGPASYLFNINWFEFGGPGAEGPAPATTTSAAPVPITTTVASAPEAPAAPAAQTPAPSSGAPITMGRRYDGGKWWLYNADGMDKWTGESGRPLTNAMVQLAFLPGGELRTVEEGDLVTRGTWAWEGDTLKVHVDTYNWDGSYKVERQDLLRLVEANASLLGQFSHLYFRPRGKNPAN